MTAVMEQVLRFPSIAAWAVAAGSLETTCRLPIESVERFSGDIAKVRQELDAAGAGQEVLVVCQTEAEARRLSAPFGRHALARKGGCISPSAVSRTVSGWSGIGSPWSPAANCSTAPISAAHGSSGWEKPSKVSWSSAKGTWWST